MEIPIFAETIQSIRDVLKEEGDNNILNLMAAGSKDSDLINQMNFLNNLGRLYECDFDMELNKLYPSIELPVSRSTPMLSSLIRWNHDKDCNVFLYKNEAESKSASTSVHITGKDDVWSFVNGHVIEAESKSASTSVHITGKDDVWSFVNGHVIDGRTIFPGIGYLVLVWEGLAKIKGKMMTDMKIVFEDVRFMRASTLEKDGSITLLIMIQTGVQKFEIAEGEVIVATGRVYEELAEICYDDVYNPPTIDEDKLYMEKKDIYTEVGIRGYHYSDAFMGIEKSNLEGTCGMLKWSGNNWVTFMDYMLQFLIVPLDTRSLYVPTSVDASKHLLAVSKNDLLPVYLDKDLSLIRCGGIDIRGMKATLIPRRKRATAILEVSKFIPNNTATNRAISVSSFAQILLENANTSKVKVVEVSTAIQDVDDLLSPIIQKTLDDIPLITTDITILTNRNITLPNVTLKDVSSLSTESNCSILIATNILENVDSAIAVSVVNEAKGFIISREDLKTDLSKFSNTPFTVVCNHENDSEMVVLLKLKENSGKSTRYVDLTNAVDNLDVWMPKLQDLLKDNTDVVLYAQGEELSGILGLVTCLKREPNGNKISVVFIMDDAPKSAEF
ncbi:Polyketide synthase dehydratase [Popillia japonica]|uniref:Polyketide synthase dehydratase n=1 Tax=Popillia japonica TaxID=7064 RepID=A0AAW1MGE9_POPJA